MQLNYSIYLVNTLNRMGTVIDAFIDIHLSKQPSLPLESDTLATLL